MNSAEISTNPLVQIRTKYDTFRTSEKKVADYILSDPESIIYLTITNIANKCDVSETSVIRLCKGIGYNGFQDLKINLAKSAQTLAKQIHEEIDFNDTTSEMISKVMHSNILAIQDTQEALNTADVERAIQAISRTTRLEFYGLGGSGAVAIDAHHKFFKYGFACNAYIDSHMQAMSAATMKKGDVIVAISNSGRPLDLIENLQIARDAGATTICITGGYNSPITKVCDIVLMAVSKEQTYKPEPMSSRIAQLSIIDILSIGLAMSHKNQLLDNLQKTRSALKPKKP